MNQIAHILAGLLCGQLAWSVFSDKWASKGDWSQKSVLKSNRGNESDGNKTGGGIKIVSVLRIGVTIILAFFSHTVIDVLCRYTYHGGDSDSIWIKVFGPAIYVAGLLLFIWVILKDLRYFWGAFFGMFMDFWDWHTVRPLETLLGRDLNLPYFHKLGEIIDTWLFWTPDLRHTAWAAWIEIGCVLIMFIIWFRLDRKRVMGPKEPYRKSMFVKVSVLIVWALWQFAFLLA